MYKRINELLGTDYKSDSQIDFYEITKRFILSEDFIKEFWDQLDIEDILIYQSLSENFIREIKERIPIRVFSALPQYQLLSEEFILEHEGTLDWNFISSHQELSESFINDNWDVLNWHLISEYQVLSEEFIRDNKILLYPVIISKNQVLSWDFMLEQEKWLDWESLYKCQPFIEDLGYKKEFIELLNKKNKLHRAYQQTKERGWFVGYVHSTRKRWNMVYFTTIDNMYQFSIKARIYWKDIITLSRLKNYEVIRKIKYIG